jgi:hypothetical protein
MIPETAEMAFLYFSEQNGGSFLLDVVPVFFTATPLSNFIWSANLKEN